VSIHDTFYLRIESWTVTNFMRERPGPFLRFLLRLPILQYHLGLQAPIARRILILGTRGRKSGKPRQTALGYSFEPESNTYLVMAGWNGRSDWYRNIMAEPQVGLWVDSRRMQAIATRLTEEENIAELKKMITQDPFAARMFSKLEGLPFDGSENWYRVVCSHNFNLRLTPID
jgi:deazaflavin-dependent oxidoreductase (nitroreductase family)